MMDLVSGFAFFAVLLCGLELIGFFFACLFSMVDVLEAGFLPPLRGAEDTDTEIEEDAEEGSLDSNLTSSGDALGNSTVCVME